MTVLVTGATGLVGPRLLRRLTRAGVECRALVRPGRKLPDGVERIEGDLDDAASLRRAAQGVTAVVHLAAVFRTSDEQAIWRVNLEGTKRLIAAVQQVASKPRFVLASTSNVYAADLDRPAREGDRTSTEHAYPASKLAAEAELQTSGLTWAVLRFPFVYGDGDGHLEATPPLLAQMGRHPAQRFSVLHHDDLAAGVQLALEGAMDGRIVNLADDAPLSVYEMARLASLTYEPSSEPLENPWQGQVDTSLATELGFRVQVPTAQQASRDHQL
ncbi:MAG: NAD-dependent epimerase/dehydratase family protein [Marmoricola sp.]